MDLESSVSKQQTPVDGIKPQTVKLNYNFLTKLALTSALTISILICSDLKNQLQPLPNNMLYYKNVVGEKGIEHFYEVKGVHYYSVIDGLPVSDYIHRMDSIMQSLKFEK